MLDTLAAVRRIPDHLPVVVPASKARLTVGLLLVVVLPAIWAIAGWEALSTLFPGPLTFNTLGWFVVLATVVVSDTMCAWIVLRQGMRGPLLAADSSGVWLRRTSWSAGAYFVPWSAVDAVRPTRRIFTSMVEIDIHAEPAPIFVPLGFTDHQPVLRTLQRLGRFRSHTSDATA